MGGHSCNFYNDFGKVAPTCANAAKKSCKTDKLGKLQAKLFDLDVEPKIIAPTFIYHYPTEISPLARRNQDNPEITNGYEAFHHGPRIRQRLLGTERPVDRRMRFKEQVREKAAGDDEACSIDEDYLRALEYGMPPAAGEGIGIDRLVMLLTDSPSIRQVISSRCSSRNADIYAF
ncbi:MAG: amino acid--tRNA ligase-related protein [Bilophila sp.]